MIFSDLKKLSSSVQALQPIKVCIRVKPNQQQSLRTCIQIKNLNIKCGQKEFSFDHIFTPQVTQKEIYTQIGKKMINNAKQGINGCIFAYGQTGSGKTYTMTGNMEQKNKIFYQNGLIQNYLLQLLQSFSAYEPIIQANCLEIYQNQLYDLIPKNNNRLNLKIREDKYTGIYVQNLNTLKINHNSEVFQLLQKGIKNRRKGQTKMNSQSSRSHFIFTVKIEFNQLFNKQSKILKKRVSKISFVDLAGSQRQKSTGSIGQTLKQGTKINQSLSHLRRVIDQLSKNYNHISYKDNKLTFFLKDCLGGNSKTILIATISSKSSMFYQTLSTLNFAKSVKQIKQKIKINQQIRNQNIDQLKQQIKSLDCNIQQLKKELQIKNNLIQYYQRQIKKTSLCQNCQKYYLYVQQIQKWAKNAQIKIQQLEEDNDQYQRYIKYYKEMINQLTIEINQKNKQSNLQTEEYYSFQNIDMNKQNHQLSTVNQEDQQEYLSITNISKFQNQLIFQNSSNFNKNSKRLQDFKQNQEYQRQIKRLIKQNQLLIKKKNLQIQILKKQIANNTEYENQCKQFFQTMKENIKNLNFTSVQKNVMAFCQLSKQKAINEFLNEKNNWNKVQRLYNQEIKMLRDYINEENQQNQKVKDFKQTIKSKFIQKIQSKNSKKSLDLISILSNNPSKKLQFESTQQSQILSLNHINEQKFKKFQQNQKINKLNQKIKELEQKLSLKQIKKEKQNYALNQIIVQLNQQNQNLRQEIKFINQEHIKQLKQYNDKFKNVQKNLIERLKTYQSQNKKLLERRNLFQGRIIIRIKQQMEFAIEKKIKQKINNDKEKNIQNLRTQNQKLRQLNLRVIDQNNEVRKYKYQYIEQQKLLIKKVQVCTEVLNDYVKQNKELQEKLKKLNQQNNQLKKKIEEINI